MMKKIIAVSVSIVSLLLMFAASSPASLTVVTSGNDKTFDTSAFPPDMKTKYNLMQEKCATCHSMGRIVHVVETGHSINGAPFDKAAAKEHCISMLRRRDSSLSKEDVKTTLEVLDYLIDEAKR